MKCDGKDAVLGTVVSFDGYIVTKASELQGKRITCSTQGGTDFEAKIIGVSEENDLALLKIETKGLKVVNWGSKAEVGQWVATSNYSDLPVAVGVLSVGLRVSPRSGMLGVQLADGTNGARSRKSSLKVLPRRPGSRWTT